MGVEGGKGWSAMFEKEGCYWSIAHRPLQKKKKNGGWEIEEDVQDGRRVGEEMARGA